MLTDQATHIETVLVTANGRILDCRSFGDRTRATEYKTAARRWAASRGIVVSVQTQVMFVGDAIAPACGVPALALAS